MGRRNEINIVTSTVLETEHYFRELFFRDFITRTKLTDGVILTENTPTGTSGKEDGSRTMYTAYWRFFTMMDSMACHNR